MSFRIIPSILEKDFSEINEKIFLIQDYFDHAQIDIVDGFFAENATWPFAATEGSTEKDPYDIINQIGNLPLSFELDLMVSKPEDTLDLWLSLPAVKFIYHLSSTEDIEKCINKTKEKGREVFVAININSNLEDVKKIIKKVDGIQCMGILNVGMQGQVYEERIENTIKEVREMDQQKPIFVDGGVSTFNIQKLNEIGATGFCVGSALFDGNVEENAMLFKDLI